jgi:Homologous recombination OB-fold protein
MFNTQSISWSQVSRLPDTLLDEEGGGMQWEDLYGKWNPPCPSFVPSVHWQAGLSALKIPLDDVHLGVTTGCLKPPFNEFSLNKIQECTKASKLLVQISSPLKDRKIKVCDMTGEAVCSVHIKVITQFSLQEGFVLLLHNVTVLPGLILNLTHSNIAKVFK